MSARLEVAIAELAAAIREELRAEADTAQTAPDRLLDIPAAARALGVGRSLVYREIGAGRLRSLRVGRRRLVPSSAIAERVAAP